MRGGLRDPPFSITAHPLPFYIVSGQCLVVHLFITSKAEIDVGLCIVCQEGEMGHSTQYVVSSVHCMDQEQSREGKFN